MTKKIAPIDFPNPRVITGTISITLCEKSYFWSVFSCIRTRNNSVFGHFSRNENTVIKLTGSIQCAIVIHIYSFYKNQVYKNSEFEMCRK